MDSAGDDFLNSDFTGDNLLGSTGDNLPESTGDDSPNSTGELFQTALGKLSKLHWGYFILR